MHANASGRRGSMQKSGESIDQYRAALEEDLGALQDKIQQNTGLRSSAFTYPYGAISQSSRDILESMGFRASLSCREGVNYITRDPDCLFRLKRVLRTPNKSSEDFFRTLAPPKQTGLELAGSASGSGVRRELIVKIRRRSQFQLVHCHGDCRHPCGFRPQNGPSRDTLCAPI